MERSLGPSINHVLFQRQVMRHTKYPATKVSLRFPHPQVPEERHKNLLDDLLSIVNGESKRDHVAQQRIAKLLKQIDDFAFDLRGFRRRPGAGVRWQPQLMKRICLPD